MSVAVVWCGVVGRGVLCPASNQHMQTHYMLGMLTLAYPQLTRSSTTNCKVATCVTTTAYACMMAEEQYLTGKHRHMQFHIHTRHTHTCTEGETHTRTHAHL